MARKEKKTSLLGLLFVILMIAVGVAGTVYVLFTRHRHLLHREMWKDYDECGMV